MPFAIPWQTSAGHACSARSSKSKRTSRKGSGPSLQIEDATVFPPYSGLHSARSCEAFPGCRIIMREFSLFDGIEPLAKFFAGAMNHQQLAKTPPPRIFRRKAVLRQCAQDARSRKEKRRGTVLQVVWQICSEEHGMDEHQLRSLVKPYVFAGKGNDEECYTKVRTAFRAEDAAHTKVFIHDNAPCHRWLNGPSQFKSAACVKKALELFRLRGIIVPRWPPQSPDLNLIENMWAWLDRRKSDSPLTTIKSMEDSLGKLVASEEFRTAANKCAISLVGRAPCSSGTSQG